MSLIEQAAKRLEELRRAGYGAADDSTATKRTENRDEPDLIERAVAHQPSVRPLRATPTPEVAEALVVAEVETARNPDAPHMDIDFVRLAAAGIVTPDAPRSQVADEFRVIKRPLIRNAMGSGGAAIKRGNLIMITSALPGEGKSFTALNLAMSIAMEFDHRVLLIDADVARPSLPGLLGWPRTRGLLDVLSGDAEMRDALVHTNIDKLSILPSGNPHTHATELLASDAMTRLLEDMSKRYPDRIVVFDSPPLLVTTEARVLATHMGQVLIVVEAQHTQQGAVKQALATIESCPVKMMMLNKTRSKSSGSGYGYGYGYSYGYGS